MYLVKYGWRLKDQTIEEALDDYGGFQNLKDSFEESKEDALYSILDCVDEETLLEQITFFNITIEEEDF